MNKSSSFFKNQSPFRVKNLSRQNTQTRGQRSQKQLKSLDRQNFKQQAQRLRKDYSNSYRFRQIKHRERANSVKQLLLKTNTIIKRSGKFLEPTKIITVSGSKWAIFDYYKNKYLRGYRSHDTHQLSVFSKLLVFATVNTIVIKNQLDISRFQVIATQAPIKIYNSGARCLLKKDDILSLEHMLSLLLIQSTQDYELMIAINIGAYLLKKKKKQYYSVYDAEDRLFKVYVQQFYGYVNSYCQLMNLENIRYLEYQPDLKAEKNKCSAFDIATLSIECLKIPLFQKIMKSSELKISIKYVNDFGVVMNSQKILQNKSIDSPFISYYNVCRNWGDTFMNSICSVYYQQETLDPIVTVILGSYSPKDRQNDIQQVIQWYVKDWRKKEEERLKELQAKEEQNKLIAEMREGLKKKRKKQELNEEQCEYEQDFQKNSQKKNKTVFNSFITGPKIKNSFQSKSNQYSANNYISNRNSLSNRRLKTDLSPQLQMILEQKLRVKTLEKE